MRVMETQLFAEAIASNFPDFQVASIEVAGEGMDNLALDVNGEYIFRFPKLKKASDHLELEATVLPELQRSLAVRIPSPEFVGTDPRTGFTFSGYRRIDGIALEPEVLLDLDVVVQNSLAEQIARFVKQLHSFPVDRAAELGVSTNDFEADYSGDLAPIRELVLPRLNAAERGYVERLYRDYLDEQGNFEYRPTLIHADLSPDHIIYDPETQEIAGIIDFSDIEIGDPDYELQWLYANYGDRFLQTYLDVNPHPFPDKLIKKLLFFYRANAVIDVLIGFDRDDSEIVESSLALLKKQARSSTVEGYGDDDLPYVPYCMQCGAERDPHSEFCVPCGYRYWSGHYWGGHP